MASVDDGSERLMAAVGAPGLDEADEVLDLATVDPAALEDAPNASADVVVAARAFREMPTPRAQLALVDEIARVLRPGGWAVFALSTDPAPPPDLRQSRRAMFRTLAGAPPQRAKDFVPLDALGATAIKA